MFQILLVFIMCFFISPTTCFSQSTLVRSRDVSYQFASVIDGTKFVVDLNNDGKLSKLTETVELLGVTAYPYYTDTELSSPGTRLNLEILPELRRLSKYLHLPIDEIIRRGRAAKETLERYLAASPVLYLDRASEHTYTSSGNYAVYGVLANGADVATLMLYDDLVYVDLNVASHPKVMTYTQLRPFRHYGPIRGHSGALHKKSSKR